MEVFTPLPRTPTNTPPPPHTPARMKLSGAMFSSTPPQGSSLTPSAPFFLTSVYPFPRIPACVFWVQHIKTRAWHPSCQTHCSFLTLFLFTHSALKCECLVSTSPYNQYYVLISPPLWLESIPIFFFSHWIMAFAFWLSSSWYNPLTGGGSIYWRLFLIIKLLVSKKYQWLPILF